MTDKNLPISSEASQPDAISFLAFDPEKYFDYIDDPSLTEAQKIVFLQTLWTIMSSFVDLGFGVDSVMPILELKALETGEDTPEDAIPTHEFNIAADDTPDEKME